MALKRYKFHLNTSTSCFLCMDKILNDDKNNSCVNSVSLQNIFKYLNIELRKIKTLSTKPTELLNKTDVRVSLCNECRKSFEEISHLYYKLEVINLRLNYNFEMIQKRVKLPFGGNQARNILEQSSDVSLRHSGLVVELRNEIYAKCEKRMANYQPRVQIRKISDFDTETETMQNSSAGSIGRFNSSDTNSAPEVLNPTKLEPDDDDDLDNGIAFDDEESKTNFYSSSEQEICDLKSSSVSSFESAEVSTQEEESVTHSNGKPRHQAEESKKQKTLPPKDLRSFQETKFGNRSDRRDNITEMFCCSKSEKRFKLKTSLYFHFNTVHLHKRYKCQTCNAVYKYQNDLYRHKKTCREKLEKNLAKERDPKFKFVCEVCGKRWDTQEGLTIHLRYAHKSVPPNCSFSCDICHKKFKRLESLKAHKDGIHLGRNFPCRFCKKELSQLSGLSRHQKFCRQKSTVKIEDPSKINV